MTSRFGCAMLEASPDGWISFGCSAMRRGWKGGLTRYRSIDVHTIEGAAKQDDLIAPIPPHP